MLMRQRRLSSMPGAGVACYVMHPHTVLLQMGMHKSARGSIASSVSVASCAMCCANRGAPVVILDLQVQYPAAKHHWLCVSLTIRRSSTGSISEQHAALAYAGPSNCNAVRLPGPGL